MSQLSYLENDTGRSRHVTGWQDEKQKRTAVKAYLKLPFDPKRSNKAINDMYLDALSTELRSSKKADVKTTFSDFCRRLQS